MMMMMMMIRQSASRIFKTNKNSTLHWKRPASISLDNTISGQRLLFVRSSSSTAPQSAAKSSSVLFVATATAIISTAVIASTTNNNIWTTRSSCEAANTDVSTAMDGSLEEDTDPTGKLPKAAFASDTDNDHPDLKDDDDPSTWGRGDLSLKEILNRHEQGLDQDWPWVWCQRNPNGPLYVFVGVDRETLGKCQQVAAAHVNHNLLLIATDQQIRDAGCTEHDFEKCRCGIHPGPVAELDLCHKICMLEDERVVAFDQLTIV